MKVPRCAKLKTLFRHSAFIVESLSGRVVFGRPLVSVQ